MKTLLIALLTVASASAATYRISSSPAQQVDRVELQSSIRSELPLQGPEPVELMPTRGSQLQELNNLRLNLGEYPGEQNPYVLPEGTSWPYPMSAPTYDGHYHLPGGQW